MVDRGAAAIAQLRKRDAERLLNSYDIDPVAALTVALRISLDWPDASWSQLLDAAPIHDARRRLLATADQASLDALAAELNERRCLDDGRARTPECHPEGGAGCVPPTGRSPR